MRTLDVERLAAGDYALIKPLLVALHLGEQVHYSDHPQLPREEIERHLAQVPSAFRGENVIYVVRDEVDQVVGFCWIVLYDPGTGLEGLGTSECQVRIGEADRIDPLRGTAR